MMDEDKLNNDLKGHISEVFDNYQDTTADEGWALLRQRYPEKEERKVLGWWLWYAAAAVILLGLGLWFVPKLQHSNGNNNMANVKHPVKPQPSQGNNVVPADSIATTTNQTALTPTPLSPAPERVIADNKPFTADRKQSPVNNKYLNLPPMVKPLQQPQHNAVAATPNNAVNSNPIASVQPKQILTGADSVNKAGITTGVIAANTNPATQTVTQATNPIDKAAVVSNKMNDLLNENPVAINKKQAQAKDKKTAISVYAATFFNYATGSDNQLNVGAGFTSDFKLSKRLKLVTGVAIAQNSLSYNNDGPNAPGGGKYSAAYANDVVSSSPSAGINFASAVPVTKNYNASLIGLDVPINLKYQFNPDKNDTFISAGLSSGTFINETYTTNYNYTTISKQTTQKSSFNGFEVARTLNLSFGMGYPLGKSNRLIVEPFLKYPLGGLGEQNIRFGAGGVNLKLNFQSTKK